MSRLRATILRHRLRIAVTLLLVTLGLPSALVALVPVAAVPVTVGLVALVGAFSVLVRLFTGH